MRQSLLLSLSVCVQVYSCIYIYAFHHTFLGYQSTCKDAREATNKSKGKNLHRRGQIISHSCSEKPEGEKALTKIRTDAAHAHPNPFLRTRSPTSYAVETIYSPSQRSVQHAPLLSVKYVERVDKHVQEEIDDLRRKRAASKDTFRQRNG